MFPLALLSIPAVILTAIYDPKRMGDMRDRVASQTSPYVSLVIRLSPLYLWLAVITLQPHKEERFLYPAYGLVLFNAAVTLYLARGWLEQAYLKATKSPYKVSHSCICRFHR
jgi:alpha-1,2-mannosyltransferase